MAWTDVEKNPFSEAVFKPQPFLSWIPGKNSSNNAASINENVDSKPMAGKHGPSLCLQAHFDSSSACGHNLIQPLLRFLFPSNDAGLRFRLAISSSFPFSFLEGESRTVCQAYLHVLFQMNASPFNTISDVLDCCVIHELSTALTYTTDRQLFFNKSGFSRHKTRYQSGRLNISTLGQEYVRVFTVILLILRKNLLQVERQE